MGLTRPIVYDVTRLVTRALNAAPNGIDRIDFALAAHFLEREPDSFALICTLLGPRLAPAQLALQTLREIEAYWREDDDARSDATFDSLVAALRAPQSQPLRLAKKPGVPLLSQNWRALRRWPLRSGPRPESVPKGAIFLNASTFLLEKPWFLSWLDRRRDVAPVFYVHDLLAIDDPEFFWPKEAAAQERRLQNICRYGAGVITGSNAVARRFSAFAQNRGRANIPVCVARPPVPPVFETEAPPPPELAKVAYFVTCGTIEPRKNHLLLFDVWRELAAHGPAPKLVIVGKRGWLNGSVTALLRKSKALQAHVVEVGGLSTPSLRRLLAGARALLAPSFDEGFGLPVAEAMAAKVPVICSDIEVFREIGGGAPDYIDPLAGLAWLAAIRDYAQDGSLRRHAALGRLNAAGRAEPQFFCEVEAFLCKIA